MSFCTRASAGHEGGRGADDGDDCRARRVAEQDGVVHHDTPAVTIVAAYSAPRLASDLPSRQEARRTAILADGWWR